MWWEILKNAKLSGKAKGTTLSSSRINIKKPEEDCIERFKDMIQSTTVLVGTSNGDKTPNESIFRFESPDFKKLTYKFIYDMGEPTVCNILRFIDSYDFQGGLKKYLDMSQDELKGVSHGKNKWKETSIKERNIDGYYVEIWLSGGIPVDELEVDIIFACEISKSNEYIYFNQWSTMKINPRRMSSIFDWRK